MHLAELLARRPVPGSAVFVTLTRQCPLGCAHCSTMSTTRTADYPPASQLERFISTFTAAERPEFLLMTGGEPLLRPGLVRILAEAARAAGTRSYLLTGAFFTREGVGPRSADDRVVTPAGLRTVLDTVDHLAVSIDAFHEVEVPRERVFRLLHERLAAGQDVSVQTCGTGPDDPYVEELTQQVRAEFHDRVPLLVSTLRPVGRGRDLRGAVLATPSPAGGGPSDRRALPCEFAAWPVVAFDGTVSACCNQEVLDGTPPEHLRLGHIGSTTWSEVHQALTASPVLRALRTRGPLQLADAGSGADYCGVCRTLSDRPEVLRQAEAAARRPVARLLEQQAMDLQLASGPVGFAARNGDASRSDLVLLGAPGVAASGR